MRLALDRRRLIGRARAVSGWTLAEYGLIALIAIQAARLFWTAAVPIGPVGAWKPAEAEALPAGELLAAFDPFFRLAPGGGPVAVTSLNLKLFGVRQDQATGRGSAIIAASDGTQKSVAVGEEIEPGVVLKSVEFDSVTIERGGQAEKLFMDQSGAAPGVPAAMPGVPTGPRPANPPPIVQTPAGPVVQPSSSVEPGGTPVPPSKLYPQGNPR